MITHDASALPRIVQCGASATMPGFSAPGMVDDTQRAEGRAAHWLAMLRLTGECQDVFEWCDRKSPEGVFIDDTMCDHVSEYVKVVMSRPGNERFYEQPGKFLLAPETTIATRPDSLIFDDHAGIVYIDDLKYGYRLVEVENNWTMLAYAMQFASNRNFGENVMFRLTIHQPRPYHPDGPKRTWSLMLSDLMVMRQRLASHLVANPTTLQTGPNCGHCPAMTNCSIYNKAAYNAIDMSGAKLADTLPVPVMASVLGDVEIAIKRLEDYRDALTERLYDVARNGQAVPGYQLQQTVGNLEWHEWVTEPVLRALTPPETQLAKTKLLTPTQLKKAIPEPVLNTLADRPNKGTKLVKVNPQKLAERMFGKISQ